MKYLLTLITILFLFGCEKEVVKPKEEENIESLRKTTCENLKKIMANNYEQINIFAEKERYFQTVYPNVDSARFYTIKWTTLRNENLSIERSIMYLCYN